MLLKNEFEKNNNKIYIKRKLIKEPFISYLVTISFLFFTKLLIGCKQRRIQLKDSIIHLKVKGIGNNYILSPSYNNLPNEIHIKDVKQNEITNNYNFEETENNVKLIWENEITSTKSMFNGCTNILEIDFSDFDTSKVIDMSYMFNQCHQLSSLNLSNFITSEVTNMSGMFYECYQLSSLNLSSFITSKVTDINNMFTACTSLKSLDLFNFDTTLITSMKSIFSSCIALSELNLFSISELISINSLFYDCHSLEFVNLKSSKIPNDFITQILALDSQYLTICSENEINENSLTIIKEMICNKISNNDLEEKRFKCYMKSISHKFNKYSCAICGEKYFQKYDDVNNIDSSINCYNSPEGYYLDLTDSLYKPCYFSCKTCDKNGNEAENNCLTCKEGYNMEINNINCKEVEFGFITSDIVKYITSDIVKYITSDIVKYITSDIISDKTSHIANEGDIIDIENDKNESIPEFIDKILKRINLTYIDNGFYKIYNKDNIDNFVFIFTSTENQKNYGNEKYITIDLGQCEYNLKKNYKIPENDYLYILQIIYEEEGMKIPKLEYEVFYPFYNNSNNLTKLNLASCKDTKVEILIKVEINDTLDKYNPKSNYYSDICTKATSKEGTDIIIKDRQKEFIDNNMSLCEENCEFIDYNYTTKKTKCSCEVKLEVPKNYDIKFNKKDFFKNFIDLKNMLNLNVMKCYKSVFKLEGLAKNYGFFIVSFIILFYVINLLIFSLYSFNKLKMNISEIVLELKSNKKSKQNNDIIINKNIFNDNNSKKDINDNDNVLSIKNKSTKIIKKRIKVKKKYAEIIKQINFKNDYGNK